MADLNPRNDSFIAMLLEVSGRARPSDLHSIPPAEAPALLEAYRVAHPDLNLAFDGDTLVQRAAVSQPAEMPSPPEAAPVVPEAFAPAPVVTPAAPVVTPAAPVAPPAAPDTTPVGAGEAGVWDFTTPTAPSVGEQPLAAPDFASTVGSSAVTQDTGAETLPSWVYQEEAGAQTDLTGFSAPAPPPADYVPEMTDFEELPAYQAPAPPTTIPWWKWLLSALLPFLGFYWYFDLRRKDSEAAKRLLVFTIAAAVVLVILVAAFVVLFGALLLATLAA